MKQRRNTDQKYVVFLSDVLNLTICSGAKNIFLEGLQGPLPLVDGGLLGQGLPGPPLQDRPGQHQLILSLHQYILTPHIQGYQFYGTFKSVGYKVE